MKAVIFDMDGVLLDSERPVIECWETVAARHGVQDVRQTCIACIGTNRERTRQIFLERYGGDFPYEELHDEAVALLHERYGDGRLPVKEGAREILSWLSERRVPAVLATSTPSEKAKRELSDAGLLGFFSDVVGGEMVAKSKPEPDIFLAAAERSGFAPAEVCVVEDSFNGIRAARRAGMFAVMVPDLLQPDDEIRRLSSAVCASLAGLLDAFRSGAIELDGIRTENE